MSITVRNYRNTDRWEYDVCVTAPNGEKVRERKKSPATSRSGTMKYAQKRHQHLMVHGKAAAPNEGQPPPTLAEFEETYFAHCRGQRQKESSLGLKATIFRTWLVPHLGGVPLNRITNRHVSELKSALAEAKGRGGKPLSAKHVNNVLTTLSTVLKAAIELEVIDAMPCRIKLVRVFQKERPFWEFEDYDKLLRGALTLDPDVHIMCLLGGEVGLRIGEIIALEQADVDYRRSFITVQRAEYKGQVTSPKGGRSRRVEMTPRVAAALKAHRHKRGPRVLYTEAGSTVDYKTAKAWLEKAERAAGLQVRGLTHMFRHTFCSHLAILGVPARTIQTLAGHADLTTTLNYMHLAESSTRSAIDLLARRGGGEIVETAVEPVSKVS